jgi:hypothetical protein
LPRGIGRSRQTKRETEGDRSEFRLLRHRVLPFSLVDFVFLFWLLR